MCVCQCVFVCVWSRSGNLFHGESTEATARGGKLTRQTDGEMKWGPRRAGLLPCSRLSASSLVADGEVRFICGLCALVRLEVETSVHVISGWSVMKSENTSARRGETFWLIVLLFKALDRKSRDLNFNLNLRATDGNI